MVKIVLSGEIKCMRFSCFSKKKLKDEQTIPEVNKRIEC